MSIWKSSGNAVILSLVEGTYTFGTSCILSLTHVTISPASEAKPTSKEQLAIDAEQDGTVFGEEKAEEKRQKDESWAQYTDTHPKGAGNTMNRG